jgi:hypothetical protein
VQSVLKVQTSISQSQTILRVDTVHQMVFSSEGFSDPYVHPPSNLVQLLLRIDGQTDFFWQILAQQAVGVFADAAFPWEVGMGKINLNASTLF